MKIVGFALLVVMIASIGSAFLMSDQGNSVRLANGTILEIGNLTISIHDSSSGGNTIFSSTIQGAIVNGSWNLMINPDVQYGRIYWKDYEINGEDLDFDGNERLQFQSSSGLINNASFFNFSMIGSCASGSAIKGVYSNGSVECESVVSGGIDLSNYALKNQSEVFAGNITAETGFFAFLGSLSNRITSLFVRDIDASGNVDVAGNVSASYILGDGSLLTNLPSAGAESDPVFVAENSTLWNSINSKLATSDQRYNDTVLINSINNNANIRFLGFYNISEVNSLIASINGGNSSFNQSLTDSLYYPISNPLNYVNITSNETILINSINSSIISWVDLFFARVANVFNRTEIIAQYYNKTQIDSFGFVNSSDLSYYNDTVLINLINQTLSSIKLTSTDQRYNETTLILGVNSSGNVQALGFYNISQINSLLLTVGNSSFNQSLTNSIYYSINNPLNFINSTQASIYNDTLLVLSVNTSSNIQSLGFYNITQVNSLISNAGNSSFNQTLTNSLYYSIFNPLNLINHTQASVYNDSVLILNVNSTLWNYILTNSLSWNSTYNLTYNNLLGQQCPTGRFVNGTLSNGTIICGIDQTGTSGNIFNQNLNTTSNVTFANVTASGGFFSFLGSLTSRIGNIFANNIDASGNVTSQFYIGSLNMSTFPSSSCSGTDKVVSLYPNGTVSCATDETGGSSGNAGTNFINLLAGAVTDTNAPAAERIVGNSQYLVCVNATGYDQFRYGIARAATNGAANANVYMKYISAPATTITASSYTNLSNSGSQILSYTNANTATLSDYYSMNSNLGDICIGAFQAGGDGVLDPQWRNIWIELSS